MPLNRCNLDHPQPHHPQDTAQVCESNITMCAACETCEKWELKTSCVAYEVCVCVHVCVCACVC